MMVELSLPTLVIKLNDIALREVFGCRTQGEMRSRQILEERCLGRLFHSYYIYKSIRYRTMASKDALLN